MGTPPTQEKPGQWDPPLALGWGVVLLVVWAATIWPLFWRLVDALDSGSAPLDEILALQLTLLGSVALIFGIYLGVLELRARTAVPAAVQDQLKSLPNVPAKELVDALARLLEAFGKLTASAALVVAALAMFGGAAALAWT